LKSRALFNVYVPLIGGYKILIMVCLFLFPFENLINNNGEERLWALMAFGLVVDPVVIAM
jgi:hypothetical protein